MNLNAIHTFLLLICLAFANIAFSEPVDQTATEQPLDKTQWEKLRKGKHYDDYEAEIKKTEKQDEEITSDSSSTSELPTKNILNGLSTVAQIVIVLLVVGIIAVLLYVLMNNKRSVNGSKVISDDLDVEIEQVEADLLNMDMKKLIKQAYQNGNQQRELRLYYLWCIQLMDQCQLVEWKREKTNSAYLRELTGKEIYWKFSSITNNINEITYGKKSISVALYDELKQSLNAIVQLVQPLNTPDNE